MPSSKSSPNVVQIPQLRDYNGRAPVYIDRLTPEASVRADSWVNGTTGIGTSRDKTMHGRFVSVWRVMDSELTNLFNGSPLARKICEKRPREMFRCGYELEVQAGSGPKIKASDVNEFEAYAQEELEVDDQFEKAQTFANLYGGYLLILGADDGGMPDEALVDEDVRSFDFLNPIDRRFAYVQDYYNNPFSKMYGRPEHYLVSNAVAGMQSAMSNNIRKIPRSTLARRGFDTDIIHDTRLIRFDGATTDQVTMQSLAGWTWSLLQAVYDEMRKFEHAFDSATYLLSDAGQAVFKMQGLINAISAGRRDIIRARIDAIEESRSVLNGLLVDAKEEEFERTATPFGGIPELLDRMMLKLAAAVDMPATELFGRAPQGMNATGESDSRKWYDTIAAMQKKELGPKLRRFYRLLALSPDNPLGRRDVKWKIHFKALSSPTDAEVATTRYAIAQTDQIYMQEGVVSAEEVALDRQDQYPSMDVAAREEAAKAAVTFDPHENDPVPAPGEPPSPSIPVPVPGVKQAPVGGNPSPNSAEAQPQGSPPSNKKPGAKAPTAKATAATPAPAKKTPPGKKPDDEDDEDKEDATEHQAQDAAIVIVFDPEGRILTVTRPEPPHEFAIPGGHVDPGETPEQAAVRELKEECGITVTELEPKTIVASPDSRNVHVFIARAWEGTPVAAEAGTKIAWKSPEALLNGATRFHESVQTLGAVGALVPITKSDFNDNHQPAGTDQGGQFAPEGGAAAGTSTTSPAREYGSASKMAADYFADRKGAADRIKTYTGRSYTTINASLNKGEPSKIALQLKEDLANAPKYEGDVHRGSFLADKTVDSLKALSGQDLAFKNTVFWSTSSSESVAKKFATPTKEYQPTGARVMMHVTQKSGVPISGISKIKSEKEVLIAPGKSFHVKSWEQVGPVTHFHVEEV